MPESIVTLEDFLAVGKQDHLKDAHELTHVLIQLSLAAKVISNSVRKASLSDILGASGNTNVHGEQVQKLDEYADTVIVEMLSKGGSVCGIASEESEELISIPKHYETGPYVICIDPLDGSSNIDVNISVGTIFSIRKKRSEGRDAQLTDVLRPGAEQCAAGYVHYGPSTMFVFTSGSGVNGFTLDPSIDEFVLSHPDLKMPSPGTNVYSVNEAYMRQWTEGQQKLVHQFHGGQDGSDSFSSRYVGSMVADFHRTILRGGIFMYPGTRDNPKGKLRLLYEVAPLGFVCEQAGGLASDGKQPVRNIHPEDLHQRIPVFLGSPHLIKLAEQYLARN